MADGDEAVTPEDPKGEEGEEEELVTTSEPETENEPQDPQDTIKATCSDSSQCEKYKARLDACSERVSGDSKTEETCEEELFDFIHCVDACVAETLFSQLK